MKTSFGAVTKRYGTERMIFYKKYALWNLHLVYTLLIHCQERLFIFRVSL